MLGCVDIVWGKATPGESERSSAQLTELAEGAPGHSRCMLGSMSRIQHGWYEQHTRAHSTQPHWASFAAFAADSCTLNDHVYYSITQLYLPVPTGLAPLHYASPWQFRLNVGCAGLVFGFGRSCACGSPLVLDDVRCARRLVSL